MKNNIIAFFSAVAMMLAIGSCTSQDDVIDTNEEATVQFSATLDGFLQSRAISDGSMVDELTFVVYDENGNEIPGLRQTHVPVVDGTATVQTHVVKKHCYTFAFWAQNSACLAYSFSDDMRSLNVDYEGLRANDEGRDAFYAVVTDYAETPITGAFERDVTLYRPFAQLNFGTTSEDLAAANLEAPVTGSYITIENGVYSQMNLLNGQASQPVSVEMATGPLPGAILTVAGENYEHISMNYLLVNNEQSQITGVKMTAVMNRLNIETGVDVEVESLPVQRNYRTNVVGRLLTRTVEWQVIIDPSFGNEYNYDANASYWNGSTITEPTLSVSNVYRITDASQLAWFQTHAPVDGSTIQLMKALNFNGNSLTPLFCGAHNITVEGADKAIRYFTVNAEGSAGLFNADGLTVRNLTIDRATITATPDASGNAWAGVVAGKTTGALTLYNCLVYGSSVTGQCGVGGFVGYADGPVTATESEVGTTTVQNGEAATAGCVGAFIGLIGSGTHSFTDCEVTNAVVNAWMSSDALSCGKFVGCMTGQAASDAVSFTRCATMAFYNGLNQAAQDHQSPYGDMLGGNQGGQGTVTIR